MFTLKIFFLGLIALVPSPDGREVTILLVDGRQGFTASDGTELGTHQAFLVARAGGCQGQCERGDRETAEFFFAKYGAGASARLDDALLQGGVWRLSESDLTLRSSNEPQGLEAAGVQLTKTRATGPLALPTTPLEATDFTWIADLGQIAPGAGGLDPDHLAPRPWKAWIVGRFRLQNGRITAYRLAGIEDQIVPIGFRPLHGGQASDYSQALADSAMVEIEIQGESIEIEEEGFGGGNRRFMRLSPENGVVEMALLNTPPSGVGHASHGAPDPATSMPAPGKHFEIFYELLRQPTPKPLRSVPHADTREGVATSVIYPRKQADSALLPALGLDDPRSILERALCPIVIIPPPGG